MRPNLFPKRLPYVILTPGYNHISAGIRALHMLCHALNKTGNAAYLAFTDSPVVSNLNTPVLQARFEDFIAVYPDIIRGNPLNALHVVRWLLGDPKVTGGDTEFSPAEKIWGYSKPTAAYGGSEKVLCLPVNDPAVFYDAGLERKGACYYAYKCESYWNEPIRPEHQGATRLVGAPSEIADILRRSEVCYVYENSSVILDARLCGCPVEYVFNSRFTEIHTEAEWAFSYPEIVENFWGQLEGFVFDTQPLLRGVL